VCNRAFSHRISLRRHKPIHITECPSV
jgi:hypothetical protein